MPEGVTERWGSRLGFVLATTGSAVGLGNVWRFPSTAADNGGGAFVLLFLAVVVVVGIPGLVAELTVFRINPISNPFLFLAVAAALAVHIAALYLPPTQFVLRLEPVPPAMWPRMLAVAASILVAVEAHKLVRRRWPHGRAA